MIKMHLDGRKSKFVQRLVAAALLAIWLVPTPAAAGWKERLLVAGAVAEGIELLALESSATTAAEEVGTAEYPEALAELETKIERHPIAGLKTAEHDLVVLAERSPGDIPAIERVLDDIGADPQRVLAQEA